ncbi:MULTISPECIES: hypothetical protein [Geobacillus]|uniref:hypothetical protein n=1 Tax=Geobacillus TaxID=129337 RepID=UPI00017E5EE7|nr:MULTISPECIES: hypothetical protein [Geobacillus]ATO38771.1 hypothetical protein GTID1_17265 [Geobacillus thermodenitrificans]MED0662180.1 hypothetical protein [Geobacillus thermodenitrificans]OQP08951.1 hypothetical protein B1691_13020 [Geobacillus sp. 47C-IIb]PJW19305.1 hypothetical protein CV632_17010 [Geobacillus thermodenitrificans]QNU32352.1 hypothetical protein IC804_06400 [Geobacillus sp. 47C-IIb]
MGKWISGAVAVVLLGIGFFVLTSEKDDAKPVKAQQQSEQEQKEWLIVGADPNNDPEYDSNFELYNAHLNSAVFVDKAIANNGGTPLSDEDYKMTLNEIKSSLDKIKYKGEEKKDELEKAKELVNQAIQNDAKKGDEIFDEIHQVIHNLDLHFNKTHFIDEKLTENADN